MTDYMKEVLDKMIEVRKTSASGYIYILEEFAEVQKEWTKMIRRGNNDNTLIIEELCDVLCTIFVQMHVLGIDEEMVRNQILYKLNRTINLWEKEQREIGGSQK